MAAKIAGEWGGLGGWKIFTGASRMRLDLYQTECEQVAR